MAYAAVTCLFYRLNHLLNSPQTSVASSTKKLLRSAGRSATRLQRTLKKYDRIKNNSEAVIAVDARIRDAACELEDAIESEASAQFLSQSDHVHGNGGRVLYLNLHHLKHEVDRFVETAKKLRAEYVEELYKKQSETVAAAAAVVSSMSTDDDDMVGLFYLFFELREFLTGNCNDGRLYKIEITGMAGMGKTAMAKNLFHDPAVKESFDCKAFVVVGQRYNFEDVLGALIAQLNVDDMITEDEDEDEDARRFFKRTLTGRKFLIVLDDVWDASFERDFTPLLPESSDRSSFVLVTSRIKGTFGNVRYTGYLYIMPFLDEDESWELLEEKVFGEQGRCPPPLVKAGKKIAEKCEGLPLLIVTVAKLLLEAEEEEKNTPEYWEEVAEMKNSVFEDAMDRIYEVLLRSYRYMTQNSRACFLYMCVFPHHYVFKRSRITNLWRAERFANDGLRDVFYYIVSSNLVVVRKHRFSSSNPGEAKACNLHIVYRHLTRREAESNEFLHVLSSYSGSIDERTKGRRRLAIYHNTLLAIKEVHRSIDSPASTLRSVLCTGPYLRYQVPVFSELKLLRVLDAASIRFYEFPVEVVKLIQLKYLSLTTNTNLPPSINKLLFLEYLIVRQHSRVIHCPSIHVYAPVEIWDMKELKHLRLVGRNLPHPPPGAVLGNLFELLDVGVRTCAKEVLESIPNLEKLRIQIESPPEDEVTQTIGKNHCFDHISCLSKLASFQTCVSNPSMSLMSKPRALPQLASAFSTSCLRKLSLSGFGYPWEDMRIVGELPSLGVLKLRVYAFRGERWEAEGMRFRVLTHLLIEDTDLGQWSAVGETFPRLEYLTMKNCHRLKEIPRLSFRHMTLLDCNPLAETCAKKDVEASRVYAEYSWK